MKTTAFILLFLTIQPFFSFAQTLNWVKSIGGVSVEESGGIATDRLNNLYICGRFGGTVDFDPGPGVYNMSNQFSGIFFAKYDSSGEFKWGKQIPANGNVNIHATSISLSSTNEIILTGIHYGNVDVDPGNGIHILPSSGQSLFIAKYDSTGNFINAGECGSFGKAILDKYDNIIITGMFDNQIDIDPGPQTVTKNSKGGSDIFLTKCDKDLNFMWGLSFGGFSSDQPFDLCTDDNGNIYLAGMASRNADLDPGTDSFIVSQNSSGFLLSLNSNGQFIRAKTAGTEIKNVVYEKGKLFYTVLASSSLYNIICSDTNFNSAPQWTGTLACSVSDIYLQNNHVYISGVFQNTVDFDPSPTKSKNVSSIGNKDIYLLCLDSLGKYVSHLNISNTPYEQIYLNGVNENILICGGFVSASNFSSWSTNQVLTSNGLTDIFLASYSFTSPLTEIHEEQIMSSIILYPNPTYENGTVFLKGMRNNFSIEIYDSKGSMINLYQTSQNSNEIKIQGLMSGLYNILIKEDTGQQTVKKVFVR